MPFSEAVELLAGGEQRGQEALFEFHFVMKSDFMVAVGFLLSVTGVSSQLLKILDSGFSLKELICFIFPYFLLSLQLCEILDGLKQAMLLRHLEFRFSVFLFLLQTSKILCALSPGFEQIFRMIVFGQEYESFDFLAILVCSSGVLEPLVNA